MRLAKVGRDASTTCRAKRHVGLLRTENGVKAEAQGERGIGFRHQIDIGHRNSLFVHRHHEIEQALRFQRTLGSGGFWTAPKSVARIQDFGPMARIALAYSLIVTTGSLPA